MAYNQPYSLQDLQDRINTLVNNDADTPETSDDEWDIRLNLINQAIGSWEMADVHWDELWTSYTHASTVGAGTTTYAIPSATPLRFPGGFVTLVLNGATQFIEVISPEEFQKTKNTGKVVYFTGNNKDGFTLNLGWSPVAGDGTVGATITFPYYKYATRFDSNSATTDTTEMSDPNFIIYDVAAKKSLMESKNNQFSIYSTEAGQSLDRMKVMNELKPPYQNNLIEDLDAISFGSIIGE